MKGVTVRNPLSALTQVEAFSRSQEHVLRLTMERVERQGALAFARMCLTVWAREAVHFYPHATSTVLLPVLFLRHSVVDSLFSAGASLSTEVTVSDIVLAST